MNIVKELEKELNDNSMKLVDPNTMKAGKHEEQPNDMLFKRALICTALVGAYQFTQREDNAAVFIRSEEPRELLSKMFNGKLKSIEERLYSFSHYRAENAREMLGMVLGKILAITRRELKNINCTGERVKSFFTMQRSHILSYVPAALRMGELTSNNTLDDRVNKMHGPFSDFFHWMEDFLS